MSFQKYLQGSLMRPWRLAFDLNDRCLKLNTLTPVHNYDITSFSNGKAPGVPVVVSEEVIFYFQWVKVEEAVPNSYWGSRIHQNSHVSVCSAKTTMAGQAGGVQGPVSSGHPWSIWRGECTSLLLGNNAALARHYATYSFQVSVSA